MPDLIVLVSYEAFQYTINKLNCLVSKTRIDNPWGGSMVDAHESTELCLVATPRGYH